MLYSVVDAGALLIRAELASWWPVMLWLPDPPQCAAKLLRDRKSVDQTPPADNSPIAKGNEETTAQRTVRLVGRILRPDQRQAVAVSTAQPSSSATTSMPRGVRRTLYTIWCSTPSGPRNVSGGGGPGSRGQPVASEINTSAQLSQSGPSPLICRRASPV